MQATAYEGYFQNGRFYASGKAVHIPEKRRVFITILDEAQGLDSEKQTAWNDFKRMVKDTAHENDLLTGDIFKRGDSGRKLIHFANEVDVP